MGVPAVPSTSAAGPAVSGRAVRGAAARPAAHNAVEFAGGCSARAHLRVRCTRWPCDVLQGAGGLWARHAHRRQLLSWRGQCLLLELSAVKCSALGVRRAPLKFEDCLPPIWVSLILGLCQISASSMFEPRVVIVQVQAPGLKQSSAFTLAVSEAPRAQRPVAPTICLML